MLSRDGFRRTWPRAVPKLAAVAVMGGALDAGFLRSPLEARLADPSVPHAILIAWLGAALWSLLRSDAELRPSLRRRAGVVRGAAICLLLPVVALLAIAMSTDVYERLDKAAMVER